MSQPGLPTLNDLPLSGTKTIILTSEDYVVSHRIPGREGGIVERVGSKAYKLEIHGFFESGGDTFKDRLLTIATSGATISIPNTTDSLFLYNAGGYYIDNVEVQHVPGFSYPFYRWRIKGLLSGYVTLNPSIPLGAIDYAQTLPLSLTAGIDYAQTLPLDLKAGIDYVRMSGF